MTPDADQCSLPPAQRAHRRPGGAPAIALFIACAALLPVTGHAAGQSGKSAWAWGSNGDGELGNGTTKNSAVPSAVATPTGVSFSVVAAGSFHSLGLDTNGHAWAWGFNGDGELGNGTTATATTPVSVTMPANVTFSVVAAGGDHSVALDTSGHAWAWGFNGDGELGNGTTANSATPVAVSMPSGVTFTAIAAGNSGQSLAIDSLGRGWGWGYNGDGELGNGTTGNSTTPVAVSMPLGVMFHAIASNGDHSLALDQSGNGWAWGKNVYGQLGNGTTKGSKTPVAVSMPGGVTFTAIAVGMFHELAVDTAGRAWAWGSSGHGQLGNGTNTNHSTPTLVSMPAGVTFTALGAGADFSLARDSNGNAWAWGYNGDGELGDGTTTSTMAPVAVKMPPATTFSGIAADGTDSDHSLALSPDSITFGAAVPDVPSVALLMLAGAAGSTLALRRLRRARPNPVAAGPQPA